MAKLIKADSSSSVSSQLAEAAKTRKKIAQQVKTNAFIIKAIDKHGLKFDYSLVKYKTLKYPVRIKCNNHGIFRVSPRNHLLGKNCPKCKESKGETAVRVALENMGLEYEQEYKVFNFHYRYDFALVEPKILIEFHGAQHYEPVELFGGLKGYQATVTRDKAKVRIAKYHGWKLITIHYSHLENGTVAKMLTKALKKLGVDTSQKGCPL